MRTRLWLTLFVFSFRVSGQSEAPTRLVPTDKPSPLISRNLVSKEELLVPRKALKEVQRSLRDHLSGNVRSSAQHLQNALQLYPNYLEAHNNLGAEYIEMHEYEKAVSELRKAVQLDPSAVQPLNNLSVALSHLQRYSDAESTARRALALDPQNSKSRYILACALVADNRDTAEVTDMLRATKSDFPEARLVLAQIMFRRGALEEAKRELQDYLAVPGIENRVFVEHWLAHLSQASVSPGAKGSGAEIPEIR